ncbi:uncharacterized protein LAESUDRAFT_765611, partial [Laetiporus sulphureus 93-53]
MSGSKFSDAGKEKLGSRGSRARRDTNNEMDDEEEDRELDEEFVCEVPKSPPRLTAAEKGKARPVTEDNTNTDQGWSKMRGPFSQAAKEEAAELGRVTTVEAERIARKYGKHPRDVLLYAGLGVKASRAANPFNKFQRWFVHNHERPHSMTKEDWNQKALEAYNEFVAQLPDDDEEARNLAFKPILDFCDALDRNPALKTRVKSANARMMAARAQFTMLAASYHNLEDMEVFGAIVYKGTDAAAKQLSVIFGGSDTIKTLIELNQVDVRQMLDNFSACIRVTELAEEGYILPSIGRYRFGRKRKERDQEQGDEDDEEHDEGDEGANERGKEEEKENERDRKRSIFTAMMQQAIQKYIQKRQ